MLFELPADLLRHSVWSQLTLKCLGQLDTAVCNKRIRPKLHESFGGVRTAVDVPRRFPPHKNLQVYVWLSSRDIRPTNFTVSDNLNIDSMIERDMLSRLADIRTLRTETEVCLYTLVNLMHVAQMVSVNCLRELSVTESGADICDELLCAILNRQQLLTHCNLSECNHLTDETIHYLAANCLHLEELSIHRCKGIRFSNSAMSALFATCINLKRVRLYPTAQEIHLDFSLQQLSMHCPHLEELDIYYTTRDLLLTPALQHCRKLRKLSLHGGSSVSVAQFAEITQHCDLLTYLQANIIDPDPARISAAFAPLSNTLTHFVGYLDETVAIACVPYWQNLVKLELKPRACTDELIQHIATCRSLTHLHLKGGYDITDAGCEIVARNMPQLRVHRINGGTNITDAGLMAIAQRCALLEEVTLDTFHKITDASVRALLVQNNIKKAVIGNCSKVSTELVNMCFERSRRIEASALPWIERQQ